MNLNAVTVAEALAGPSTRPDNRLTDEQRGSVEEAPKGFRQALRERKEDTSSLPRTHDNTRLQEQLAGSEMAAQPDLVQGWLTQSAVTVENIKANSAREIESKSGHKLAELTANIKNEKSTPVTGRAANLAEVKLLESGEKVKARLKTVLPEKSKGLNGLKGIQGHSPKAVATKQKLTSIADSTGKISASKTIDSTVVSKSESGKKTASAVDKTTVLNIPPVSKAPKAVEILQKSVANEPGKSVRAFGVEAALDTSGFDKAKETLSAQRKGLNHAGKDALNNPSLSKSDAAEVQVDISQIKNHYSSSANSSSYEEISQIVAQSGPETQAATNSFSASTANAKSSDFLGGSFSADVSLDVGKQILESIHTSISQQAAEKQVTVRLNPPELGQVFVKLQEQDGQITGVLEVSKAQTKLEIEQALPEITRNLASTGVQVNRIEVVLSVSEHSVEHGAKDALLNDGSYQQQSSSDYGSTENDYETDDAHYGLSNDSVYWNIAESREMYVVGSSINILI